MRKLGYGRDYRYPHDFPGAHVPMSYLPEDLQHLQFYQPTSRGYEVTLAERLRHWRHRGREERQRRRTGSKGKQAGGRRRRAEDREQRQKTESRRPKAEMSRVKATMNFEMGPTSRPAAQCNITR
jgi:hypothetical protein